jgi:putative ABC transport system substrate-binding protein
MLGRRTFLGVAGSAAAVSAARAQPASPVVGFLMLSTEEGLMAALRRGLERGGYVEGRNVAMLVRSADGRFEQLPQLAAELVERRVSVILAWGSSVPARAAKAATTTIPIVFAYGGDPVGDGLVPNFNRPGGNVTGVTVSSIGLLGKRLEMARAIVPGLADVGLLVNTKTGSLAQAQIANALEAAPRLGLRVHLLDVSSEEEIERAFATIERSKFGALVMSTDPLFAYTLRHQVVARAARYRLPVVFGSRTGPDAGGLISYGTKPEEAWQQAGIYAARILKGEKAGDLPVIQGARFETVVNLKTARALGLQIPPSVLAGADEVIE